MADHDLSKVEADRELLREAQRRGPVATLGAYLRLSGPGWLQSAITLGGGSLASSLYLGVLAGTEMLWLQPLAMLLGIIMLSAIAYVTSTTGRRPFEAINRHVNPVLGWGWAIASLVASMVWCLPQYSLAVGVLEQNLLPQVADLSSVDQTSLRVMLTLAILVLTTAITFSYDSGKWGIKLYEFVLKLMVLAIVACFAGVVIQLALSRDGISWGQVLAGFVPDFTRLYQPASGFAALLAAVPEVHRGYWTDVIIHEQRSVMISAAATAVGINMTFLFPYSILARGWTREFRGLARFDLATGMFIPYLLATSCVVIAAASQFHPRPASGEGAAVTPISAEKAQEHVRNRLAHQLGPAAFDQLAAEEIEQKLDPLSPAEHRLAAHLAHRDAFELARALEPLTGSFFSNVIFGLGVLGMTLSTITILMLISGFVICEMLGLPARGWTHRLATLAAAVGVLGPFVWQGEARFYLAVPTSVFGMVLLPIAYLAFFLLMNQRSLLGDEMPRGARRWAWNLAMAVATVTALGASLASILMFQQPLAGVPVRTWALGLAGGFVLLALVVQLVRPRPAGPK